MDFTTAAQLLALCQEGSVTLGEAMLRREMDLTGASREEIMARLERSLEIMEQAAAAALAAPGRAALLLLLRIFLLRGRFFFALPAAALFSVLFQSHAGQKSGVRHRMQRLQKAQNGRGGHVVAAFAVRYKRTQFRIRTLAHALRVGNEFVRGRPTAVHQIGARPGFARRHQMPREHS